ncbi:MAG: DUF2147 domain-containing protein [Bacteroidales bacterium]|nr:DUF2147 domain-containing protein [Paludibacteraceae bacterium]MBN2664644.1 DUF2147 domain-containing protein [Bacteroidales bacterium]
MKRIHVIFILLLVVRLAGAQNPADRILGTYITDEKDAKVEVYKKNGKYYGKICWLKTPYSADGKPLLDKNNPNKAFRSRPVMGLIFLSDFVYSKGEWINGKIYAPKEGMNVNGRLKFLSNNELEVKASYLMISATRLWTKIK